MRLLQSPEFIDIQRSNFMEDFKHARSKFEQLNLGVRVDEVKAERETEREKATNGVGVVVCGRRWWRRRKGA
jgi:hypothetical protein